MTLLVLKKGQLDIEKALGKMDWDTEKFEEELEVFAKTQSPQIQERLRKQYNRYMGQCGWPMEIVVVPEAPERTLRSVPKMIPKTKIKPESENENQVPPQTTSLATIPSIRARIKEPEKVENQEKPEEPAPILPQATHDLPDPTVGKPEVSQPPQAVAKFKFADAILFKKLCDTINVLVDEVTFKFETDYFTIRHMDPSRVAMFDCKINKEVFEEWCVTKPGLCTFNIEEVKKVVFSKIKKDTYIEFEVKDEIPMRATFTLKDNRTRERSFPVLEASFEEIPDPKIAWTSRYKLVAKQVAEDIADLTNVSDHVVFIGTNDMLQMKAEGDIVKGSTTYKRGDDTLLDIDYREESKATFSLSYLKEMIDPTLCDLVTIDLATDMPIKITMTTRFGNLIYYIAPRIETD